MDQLLDNYELRLNTIKQVTEIQKCRNNLKEELQDLNVQIKETESDIRCLHSIADEVKTDILSLQNHLYSFQNILDFYCKLNNDIKLTECINDINNKTKLDDISKQLFPENYEPDSTDNKIQTRPIPTKKAEESKEPKTSKTIRCLNEKEFSSIPKYIIGRNDVTTLNNFVSTLNKVLQEKYSLLALGKLKAKNKNKLQEYLKYKSQETTVRTAKGSEVHFFTEEDYHHFTQFKLDKIKLNFLAALRHVKRIEFIKIGKDLYYGVI